MVGWRSVARYLPRNSTFVGSCDGVLLMGQLLSPGAYLRKRREAAGVTLDDMAAQLAGLPWRVRPPHPSDVALMLERLEAAEADRDNLTVLQASLVLNVFPLDIEVYEQLLLHHHARRAPWIARSVPIPRVCRRCACSDRDGCRTDRGMCAWARGEPALCTACERIERAAADVGGQPDPFTAPAPRTPAEQLAGATAFIAERELGRSTRPASERMLRHG
jgi:hypothetical protein